MYTPQQTAKPLSAYDSYIQQSLATREALRVRPHAHTPKTEPLPPTAGLEGATHAIPIQEPDILLPQPDIPIPPTIAAKPKAVKSVHCTLQNATPIAFATPVYKPKSSIVGVVAIGGVISHNAGNLVPVQPHTGTGCRAGPA